jgi:hypothetical protein
VQQPNYYKNSTTVNFISVSSIGLADKEEKRLIDATRAQREPETRQKVVNWTLYPEFFFKQESLLRFILEFSYIKYVQHHDALYDNTLDTVTHPGNASFPASSLP